MNDNDTNKEAILTGRFIKWYSDKFNFIETFDDSDTSGSDPFDSAGFIDNKLVFIEFKHRVSLSQISYKNSLGSSIEKKIGQLLKLLYNEIDSKIFNSIKSKYNDKITPHLIIACDKISERATLRLNELLFIKSHEWFFTYEVLVWKNDKAISLTSNFDITNKIKSNREIHIPDFPSTAKPRKNRLNSEIAENRFIELGQEELFQILTNELEALGGKRIYNKNNLNFKFPNLSNKTIFGIWPFKSNSENGILLTFWFDGIIKEFNQNLKLIEDLGLIRNDFKVGHLGYNAYIKDKKTLKTLLQKIKKCV